MYIFNIIYVVTTLTRYISPSPPIHHLITYNLKHFISQRDQKTKINTNYVSKAVINSRHQQRPWHRNNCRAWHLTISHLISFSSSSKATKQSFRKYITDGSASNKTQVKDGAEWLTERTNCVELKVEFIFLQIPNGDFLCDSFLMSCNMALGLLTEQAKESCENGMTNVVAGRINSAAEISEENVFVRIIPKKIRTINKPFHEQCHLSMGILFAERKTCEVGGDLLATQRATCEKETEPKHRVKSGAAEEINSLCTSTFH